MWTSLRRVVLALVTDVRRSHALRRPFVGGRLGQVNARHVMALLWKNDDAYELSRRASMLLTLLIVAVIVVW